MSVVHLEDTVKHGIGRLQGSVADIIDNSQALARSALIEAAHAFEHSREQAMDTAQDALRYSRREAQRSYGQFEKAAGQQPLAAIAIGVGIGVVIGFILHAGAAKPRPVVKAAKAAAAQDGAKPIAASARAKAKPISAPSKTSSAAHAGRPRATRSTRATAPANGSVQ